MARLRYDIHSGVTKAKTRITMGITAFGLLVGGGGLSMALFSTANAATPEVVYDALPSVSPSTNYPSQPFQAQQTFEFGDYIHLGGTARVLNTVTVTMSDWAKYSDYSSDTRYSGDSTHWTHPITLNVYTNHLDSDGTPDQQIATVTQTVSIPWRPASDPTCGSTSNGAGWKDGGVCYDYSGLAFNATFDLSSLNVTLPNDIIATLAFNTQTWGDFPEGQPGPYNSLNVAVPEKQAVTVGSDDSADATFWNTHTCAWYSNPNATTQCTGGNYGLYEDTNWTPYGTVALQITASEPQVLGKVTGGLTLTGPKQQISFNAFDYGANSASDNGTVEYQNFDYPGGLHYTADVTCANINQATHEAWFMFQIPAGHPGLSGLYVVSYVKDGGSPGTKDTYGHAASGNHAQATGWCENGNAPVGNYVVKGGNAVVHKN